MLHISPTIVIPDSEIELHAIRAQGAGGQNVNKVSTAVHLRFDIRASSLPEHCKSRLLALPDARISDEGVIVIKAQSFNSQPKNRADALARLTDLIQASLVVAKTRRATRPTRAAQTRRVDTKTRRGRTKALRGRVGDD